MNNQEVQGKVKKPFYKKVWFWIAVVVVVAIGASGGAGKKSGSSDGGTMISETEEKEQEEIIYTSYTASQMLADLDSNALKAESTYNNQYIEVTGRLGTIDSSGDYISLLPEDDEWAIIGIQCYIKTDEQKEQVMELTSGDTITVRGKIKSVGEVMGYSLDIDSIN